MVRVELTAAEWDMVMACLDPYNSDIMEVIKETIDEQLANQEY